MDTGSGTTESKTRVVSVGNSTNYLQPDKRGHLRADRPLAMAHPSTHSALSSPQPYPPGIRTEVLVYFSSQTLLSTILGILLDFQLEGSV